MQNRVFFLVSPLSHRMPRTRLGAFCRARCNLSKYGAADKHDPPYCVSEFKGDIGTTSESFTENKVLPCFFRQIHYNEDTSYRKKGDSVASTAKGNCYLCGAELGKVAMKNHLMKTHSEAAGQECCLLKIEGAYNKNYWLYVDIPISSTL